ncbi:RTA1-like protein 11 [Elsinoe fawcettii]|nr:RTA1-like protein 11 [Elsinoe fawcettii]
MSSLDLLSNPYYKYYVPSLPPSVVFATMFSMFTITHIGMIKWTKRYFGVPLVVGGCFELIGFIARAMSHKQLTALPLYVIQIMLILLAPILFAAGIYMFLGRIITASTHTKFSIIRTTRLTKFFVGGDILCFLIQAFGATKLVKPKSADDVKTGQHIVLVGLALQVAVFGLFLIVAVIFHRRVIKSRAIETISPRLRISLMLWTLYLASILIMVRNTHRFVEYILPHDGHLIRNEWPTYALDAGMMAIVMMATVLWYGADLEAHIGKEEMVQDKKGAGDRAKRPTRQQMPQTERLQKITAATMREVNV